MSPPRLSIPLITTLVGTAGALAAGAAARRWLDAVEVRGGSMAPTLLPGDRLLVESSTFTRRRPRAGELVLAPDPRDPARELVKRVAAADSEAGKLELRGDAPGASTDSRAFGAVPSASVQWRVLARYWPPSRVGRLDG
ncbi:MAG TPA: nickel-type superoxide dismutase maturation protease [Candidatus Limnocylindria bacterium]|jgi:nickel-type superoxide dismutase maturation protease